MPLAEACFNFVSTTVPPAFEKATKEEDMDKWVITIYYLDGDRVQNLFVDLIGVETGPSQAGFIISSVNHHTAEYFLLLVPSCQLEF